MTTRSRRLAASLSILGLAWGVELTAQHIPFSFERFAQERGLSNGTVTAIAQGRHGFLWFGTQDGLNLYDGTGFTVYRPVPGDTTSIADAWITALSPGRSGTVWVGTLHGGVQRLDPRVTGVRRIHHAASNQASLASDDVSAVWEASDGTLWVGTVAGLDAVDTATGHARHFLPATTGDSARFSNDVISLGETPGGTLWVGSRRNVYAFDRTTHQFEQLNIGLHTREIKALLVVHDTVWIGTPDDLVAIDNRTHEVLVRYTRSATVRNSPVADGVTALASSPDGTIWIGSDNGAVALTPSTGAFERHTRDPRDPRSLAGPIVRSLYVDRSNVLWIGVESYGLSKHASSAITFDLLRNDSSSRSLSDGYVRGITQDHRGNLWIGTQHGGIDRIDANTGAITVFRHHAGDPHSLPGDNVWAFLEDHAGVAWIGLHEQGFGAFNPATGAFTRSPFVPFDASVNVLYEDRAGALYVGTEGRGLYVIAPDRRSVTVYGSTMGDKRILADNDVESVLEDKAGRLWIGAAAGLTRIDPNGHATIFRGIPNQPGALGSSFVTNIIQDSKGALWIATKGGGLNRFDNAKGTFTSFGTAQGLPHSFVYGILEDAHHRLWLSTDDGIAMFDPLTGFVTRYGLIDGLQAREFNRRAHYRAADGTMYFGGINGVNIVRPDALGTMPAPPAVSLISLETDGARRSAIEFTADSVITLPYDANSFTISFAALDFSAPEKIRYAYKLEGVDRDWIPAGDRHQATYASVPTGRHEFRVIAANAAGEWNRRGAAVTFVATPAWWATWWARALQLLLVIAVVWGVVRLRLASSRRTSMELERRVDDQTRSLVEAQARLHESLERERESARELADMTAAVPGAVFQLRETAKDTRQFVFASEGIARLFPEAMSLPAIGSDPVLVAELLFSRIDAAGRALMEQALASSREKDETWRQEFQWAATDTNDLRWLAVQAHGAIRADGSFVWTGVMTDVTAARIAEVERAELESKMQQTQKAESLALLAGGVAHDFNNVLVSVVVGAELLEYQIGENPKAAETVRRIRSAGFRAAELTQQMLAYAGKGRISVERVSLAGLVEEMLSLLRATVPRTIELALETGPDRNVVEADATQLRQIVMNLITNASEAIGDAAGRVAVRVVTETAPRSELTLLHAAPDMPATGPYVLLDVSDNGSGMAPEMLARIFDPFFTTKFTGRGLGLAALLGIVRAHHGGVNVVTSPGNGTRFVIYLPLVTGAETVARRVEVAAPMAPGTTRVLVADDEEAIRDVAKSVLEQLGYEVTLACDGQEALDAAGDPDIDVILLDITMPRLNGALAARTLREKGVRTPIVLMSGYAEEDLLTRGLTVDADAFLKKPFLASELAKTLREVVRTRPVS